MNLNETWCYKVSDVKKCKFCKSSRIVKNGTSKNKKQLFKCKECRRYFIIQYSYKAYNPNINDFIIKLTKEGLGVRSTARVLKISTTTVLKRIILIARTINKPKISPNRIYEIDEMRSFINRKTNPIWIVYALDRASKSVVSFNVGNRTKKTLNHVTNSVVLSNPKKVYTDKLIHYKSLLEDVAHKVNKYGTNRIERKNLTLRTHIKRLSRKTICFSREKKYLEAHLRIYFWA
ncbi:IS1 family transposase [Flavobacterium sp. NRK F10]|uniref:IS1 family transposase n=1 Tax=Flavobacterium sp. NRK F10 TaxID=2954931 RepID=UPI00209099EF|nr:IS1 family transposase [Flavobacterium sp. NRK F10]MCO6175376.1 IS1 family transposase [Flavobacterium sp. NRK F10]